MKYQEANESNGLSPQRKLLYYGGMVLSGIGLFLILSIFVTAALSTRVSERPSFGMFIFRGIGGMVLMIAGGIVRGIGENGPDASGAASNPKMARDDLEPFTDAVSGMTREATDRSGFVPQPLKSWEETEPIDSEIRYTPRDGVEEFRAESRKYREATKIQVMVRCRYCRSLGPEDANYCDQCGAKL